MTARVEFSEIKLDRLPANERNLEFIEEMLIDRYREMCDLEEPFLEWLLRQTEPIDKMVIQEQIKIEEAEAWYLSIKQLHHNENIREY